MTHEWNKILAAYQDAALKNRRCVLATVVDVDGSSYRRPGVRMLVSEDGTMTGAISGGCVEKDVLQQAQQVFRLGKPQMMAYEGKYKLGCEGTLYILIEPFAPNRRLIEQYHLCLKQRQNFHLVSYYSRNLDAVGLLGSVFQYGITAESFSGKTYDKTLGNDHDRIFTQRLDPMFHLLIIGAEHDAVKLSNQASMLGWQVTVLSNPFDRVDKANFSSANVICSTPAQFVAEGIDEHCAVVIMTHNFAKDLNYLLALKNTNPCYIGLLGPVKRRNKLLDELIERGGFWEDAFMKVIHGPAGLDLGAETAEEIALSICSEIIALKRKKDASPLNNLKASIHCEI